MGQAATDLERRGISTERGDTNRVIRMGNQLLRLEIESKNRSQQRAEPVPAISGRLEEKLAARASKREAEARIAAKLEERARAREIERAQQAAQQKTQQRQAKAKPKDRGWER